MTIFYSPFDCRKTDPFIGLFADPFVGGTELEGGVVSNAIVVINFLVQRLETDYVLRGLWLPEILPTQLDLIKETAAALLRCLPLAKAKPQVCRSV